jgi:hypothetical protein
MLSDFRFGRRGVFSRMIGFSMLAALAFIAGCTTSKSVAIGPPAKLAFTSQPASASAGGTFSVTVSVEDANGNVVPTATNMVTIAMGSGSGTLSGTTSVAAVAGVATFSNLSINNPGKSYTLAASSTGLTGVTSSTFTVAGPATQLAFTVQPANVAAGNSISPAVTVSIEDALGDVVPTATNQVTVAEH